ncbi:MAG: thioesterase domain-containing protein [Hyphomicrobiales bacterium]
MSSIARVQDVICNGKLSVLRRGGRNQNLVFVPDIGGSVLYSRIIIPKLHPEITVFGAKLTAQIFETLETTSLSTYAQNLATQISSLRTDGKVNIIGHSFAGTLAYEITRILKSHNFPVDKLILVDSGLPAKFWETRTATCVRLLEWTMHSKRSLIHRYNMSGMLGLKQDKGTYVSAPGYALFDLTIQREPMRHIIKHLYRAFVEYEPLALDHQIYLMRADRKHLNFLYPIDLGWNRFVSGQIKVINVPGDHLDLVRDKSCAEIIATAVNNELFAGSLDSKEISSKRIHLT